MGYISSINFKKSNTIQTRHNDRDLPPSYLIGADREVNHTHKDALKLRNQMIKNAIEAYTKHRGQKFQAKSYEWSAVCNIKPETTIFSKNLLHLFYKTTLKLIAIISIHFFLQLCFKLLLFLFCHLCFHFLELFIRLGLF